MDALIQATKDGDQSKLQDLTGSETLIIEGDDEESDGEEEEEVYYLYQELCSKNEIMLQLHGLSYLIPWLNWISGNSRRSSNKMVWGSDQ